MRKVFQNFANQFSVFTKMLFKSKALSIEKQNLKTKTKNKAYLTMPMTFDFIAYFDDNDLENNAEDIYPENPTIAKNTEVYSLNDEKCNEKVYSSNIHQFECSTN